jgi:hypothetical protein
MPRARPAGLRIGGPAQTCELHLDASCFQHVSSEMDDLCVAQRREARLPFCRPPPGADDIWGDDDDQDDGSQDHLDREWRARREEHYSSGYREGLEAGKHQAVQGGFDEGGSGGQRWSVLVAPHCPAVLHWLLELMPFHITATFVCQAIDPELLLALSVVPHVARRPRCGRWHPECRPSWPASCSRCSRGSGRMACSSWRRCHTRGCSSRSVPA